VGQFVKRGAVIVDLCEEDGLRRHLDDIERRDIESAVAPDVERDPARRDQRFGDGHDLAVGQRCGVGGEAAAQAVALRDVEHGEALEERHGLGGVAALDRARLFGLGNEAVGIDDGRAALAFPDRAARLDGLFEGEP
jgi:hypothetical protein